MTEKDQREAKDIYRVTNEAAAADMRKRALLVLVEMKRGIGAWDEATLVEAMERLERLPVVEERR